MPTGWALCELGKIMKHAIRFSRDRSGATSIEYAVILAGMGLAVIGILSLFGVQLNGLFLLLAAANT
jgi:Flp pilus assembly pilin Flp